MLIPATKVTDLQEILGGAANRRFGRIIVDYRRSA
jgi:hypothetical protein